MQSLILWNIYLFDGVGARQKEEEALTGQMIQPACPPYRCCRLCSSIILHASDIYVEFMA